jgi:uncharacterized protein (TIGR02246 family)
VKHSSPEAISCVSPGPRAFAGSTDHGRHSAGGARGIVAAGSPLTLRSIGFYLYRWLALAPILLIRSHAGEMHMNCSTLIRTCLALVVCFTAQAENNVQTLADSWAEAYNEHDRSALGALYTEDALLMMHGAATVSGRSEIADFWSGDFQADNPLTLLKVTQTVQGSDMALVHGDYRVVSRDDGSALGQGRFAHIWTASSNGEWRLDRDLWQKRSEPVAP